MSVRVTFSVYSLQSLDVSKLSKLNIAMFLQYISRNCEETSLTSLVHAWMCSCTLLHRSVRLTPWCFIKSFINSSWLYGSVMQLIRLSPWPRLTSSWDDPIRDCAEETEWMDLCVCVYVCVCVCVCVCLNVDGCCKVTELNISEW